MYYVNSLIILAILCTIIISCVEGIKSVDFKKIIAYSSIGHMNFALGALILCDIKVINPIISLLVSHGIITTAYSLFLDFYIK